jgi:Protein kinase domain
VNRLEPNDSPHDSLGVAREVDAICDRYEEARATGVQVRLEDFLPPDGPLRAAALVELVRLEFEHRLQAGEGVHAEEYYNRYPELRQDAALARQLQDAVLRLRPEARPTLQPWETELGAPSTAAVSPPGQPPEKFGRYRIVKVLGQGGMGIVYQAHDTNLDRPVALKVMRFGMEDPDRVERFYREARIAALFTHPNLCPIYDAGELDGFHYLTMPLLVGEPLAARLRRTGPMPVQTAATLAASIARAVHEAHRAGVLHRDLKPANIMIDDRQHPVVLDFGLARRFRSLDPRITSSGVILGTPAYMAPEQIASGSDAGGPSQDIYSLGVVLYEMLTGRVPFIGTMHEVLTRVLTVAPPRPSVYRPGLDAQLERACLRALAKNPKQRYPTMAAFADALESIARPDGRRVHFAPSRRLVVVVLGLLGLAGIAVGIAAWAMTRAVVASSLPRTNSGATTPLGIQPGADNFQAGSVWRGTFQWIGIEDTKQPAKVEVKERRGDYFRGVYTANGGDYIWAIEGTIRGSNFEWKYTEIIHEKDVKHVAGVAKVEGRFVNENQLEGIMWDGESRAKVSLDLWK